MFSSVCDATWPIDLAGDQRARVPLARQPLGDAQHQPPVDHDAQLGRHRRAPPAAAARRTAPASAATAADASSAARRSRAPSPATRATGSGSCESESAAPSSRAASSGRPRPASRCRPTAGTRRGRRFRSAGRRRPAPCRRSRTRSSGSISMWIVSAGCSRSTRQPFASLMQPADLALDLRRRERQPLVGARRRHAERRRRRDRRGRRGSPPPARRSRAARGRRSEKFAMPNTRPSRSRTSSHGASAPSSISIRPMTIAPTRTCSPASARLEVAHQQLNEPGPVPPLQRQLLVVDDDRVHESGNWVIG